MSHTEDLARIVDSGVVAIVRLDSADRLVAVAEAVLAGGIDVIEFTMTTPGALDVLRQASEKLGDSVVLGAGTVLDAATTQAAILAGARFIVSPSLSPEVIQTSRRYGVVSIPGAYTPTEILTAWESGADLVKVFPASALGPSYIRDILAPLPQVKLVPTGGVDLDSLASFIKAGAAAVAVGSNLVSRSIVAAADFDGLTRLARAFKEALAVARAESRIDHTP